MTEIKVGTVAVLKTTDEPCYILEIHKDARPEWAGGTEHMYATVRRPQQTENGIVHNVDEFRVGELESLDDKKARVLEEYMGFQAANKASVPNGANSSIPDLTFGN